jgi:hypothetical protein
MARSALTFTCGRVTNRWTVGEQPYKQSGGSILKKISTLLVLGALTVAAVATQTVGFLASTSW